MSSERSPYELKEMALHQLLEIRERLLSPESQEVIDNLSQEDRHDVILLVSKAQINYLKLQKAMLEEITDGMRQIEPELLTGIDGLKDKSGHLLRIEKFIENAGKFVKLVASVFAHVPPVA